MTTQPFSFPRARQDFAKDPFGYSALGSYKWASACLYAGHPIDESTPIGDQLKNPILWMAQAHAMTKAAQAVLLKDQGFESMPLPVRGVCESQYCAVGLMLVGYSLEICLKAMMIVKEGVEGYTKAEKKVATIVYMTWPHSYLTCQKKIQLSSVRLRILSVGLVVIPIQAPVGKTI